MSAYSQGNVVLGALFAPRAKNRAWFPPPLPTAVIAQPSKVTVNPLHAASTVMDSAIDRVAVTGGNLWFPSWAPGSRVYDNPAKVIVYTADGRSSIFTNVQTITIDGGSVVQSMRIKSHLIGEDSYVDVYSEDFRSGVLDGINGNAPWFQSLKSTNYKAGFCKGWKQGQAGECPIILGGDISQGARVARSQASIASYGAMGIVVAPDQGTVSAVNDSGTFDVQWDSGGKVERSVPASDIAVIGASPSKAASSASPALTAAQLAVLDRALTPAEQKLVDDFQSGVATAMQVVEEAKGGPTAKITVTPKGATVMSSWYGAVHDFMQAPLWAGGPVARWQAGLGALALGAVGTGIAFAVKRRK